MKSILICAVGFMLGCTALATSITTPIFSEEETLQFAHDVVLGEVIEANFIGKGRGDCFASLVKLKVSKSYSSSSKIDEVLELALTENTILPIVGQQYLFVYNKKSDEFYSWCKKPRQRKYKNYDIENINTVYRTNYARIFENENSTKFEFCACNQRDDFFYQSNLSTAQLSTWESTDGKTCKKMTGDYEELKNLILTDFPKAKDKD